MHPKGDWIKPLLYSNYYLSLVFSLLMTKLMSFKVKVLKET